MKCVGRHLRVKCGGLPSAPCNGFDAGGAEEKECFQGEGVRVKYGGMLRAPCNGWGWKEGREGEVWARAWCALHEMGVLRWGV